MHFLNAVKTMAEATTVSYPFPTIVFGAIAFGIFTVLLLVTWSYRDVANRHDHKDSGNKGH